MEVGSGMKPLVSPTYSTTSQSAAAWLRYSIGDNAHTGTIMETNNRARFEFRSSPELSCEELVELYYGSNPVVATDASRLLVSLHKIQKTMTAAHRSKEGIWRNQNNE
jgi:hypothetical protein